MAKIDQQIKKVQREIDAQEEKLQRLKLQYEELIRQKEQSELQDILVVTKKRGISLEQVKQIIEVYKEQHKPPESQQIDELELLELEQELAREQEEILEN